MFVAEPKATKVAVSASVSVPDSTKAWRKIVEPIEPFLGSVARRLSEQVATFEPEIAPYAEYALTNQGKQLRPALVALSAGAMAEDRVEGLVEVAVIIEMIHLATLVHDDVMDEAALRRRLPTLARNWGNQISVLLGDCLFAHALKLAANFPTTEVCQAVATATKTVCSGEILQTHRLNRKEISRAEYFQILRMKTGELFAVSCDMGGWLAGSNQKERKALRSFGLHLGTAYQIYDDCLDIFGSESTAGKSLGTDLMNGKLTLPVLIALEQSGTANAVRLRELLDGWKPERAVEMLALLSSAEALSESRVVIQEFLTSAIDALDGLTRSSAHNSLKDLCAFLAQQTQSLGV
jgi:octaprenyl-diphosphate synthase